MPTIRLIPDLPAALVVVNPFATDRSQILVLVADGAPWRLIYGICRALLWRHERRELARVLLTH